MCQSRRNERHRLAQASNAAHNAGNDRLTRTTVSPQGRQYCRHMLNAPSTESTHPTVCLQRYRSGITTQALGIIALASPWSAARYRSNRRHRLWNLLLAVGQPIIQTCRTLEEPSTRTRHTSSKYQRLMRNINGNKQEDKPPPQSQPTQHGRKPGAPRSESMTRNAPAMWIWQR